LTGAAYFSKIYHHSKFKNPTLDGANAAILMLLMAGNEEDCTDISVNITKLFLNSYMIQLWQN
jgi:hypothetical protein